MKNTEKEAIKVDNGPAAIGPYSLGIKVGELILTSGQLGLDASSGMLVPGGIEAETKQALINLQLILEAAHSSMNQVVKTTVFLKDMADFAKMNAVYAQYFTEKFPARSAVQVAALPKNAMVEIEAVAVCSQS